MFQEMQAFLGGCMQNGGKHTVGQYNMLGEQIIDSVWFAGDIIYFSVLQKSVVVLNSAEVARDLLEKRSSIYSCRPHVPMAGDVYGACFCFSGSPIY